VGGTVLQNDPSNLHWAATTGNAELLELVLTQRPDLDRRGRVGETQPKP